MSNPYYKEKEIYGYETYYREVGYYIQRLEDYVRSLPYFDEALKRTPDDLRALRGRSIVRAKDCQYKGALVDTARALELDPDDIKFLADKSLWTYLDLEFEDAMVQNVRLVPVRQKPDNFVIGVMECRNSIENCIGERSGRPLRDHFKIIRKLAWKQYFENNKSREMEWCPVKTTKKKRGKNALDAILKKHAKKGSLVPPVDPNQPQIKDSLHSHKSEMNVIPKYYQSYPFQPLQRYTSNIENYMAEKYLDSMYRDKNFLKKAYKEPGAVGPNKKGSVKLKNIAKTVYKQVCYKQELLRTRRPFYHLNFLQVHSKGALKERQQQDLAIQQLTASKEADILLHKLQKACHEKKFLVVLNWGNKLREYCYSKPKRLLPEKDEYNRQRIRLIRQSYFDLNRLNDNQYPWDQEKRIYVALKLPISREPSTDSVIEEYQDAYTDVQKDIETCTKLLEATEDSDEMCWCLFELCRNNATIKKWELATLYGKKCIQESVRTKDFQWTVNVSMVLAKAAIEQQNKTEAKTVVLVALSAAKQLENKRAQHYLERCLNVIEQVEFDDNFGPRVQQQRQTRILDLMGGTKIKEELSHLFTVMKSLPAQRRMTMLSAANKNNLLKRTPSSMKENRSKTKLKHTEVSFSEKGNK